jgi:hypothetical protein
MKPLQSVAMGLVIVVLSARFGGYDALPDPVGWLLTFLGVRALPDDLPHRTNLLGLAALAGVVATIVWFPAVTGDLYDADASLAWPSSWSPCCRSSCSAAGSSRSSSRPTSRQRWSR